jgi:hypothetical protein
MTSAFFKTFVAKAAVPARTTDMADTQHKKESSDSGVLLFVFCLCSYFADAFLFL